MAPHELVQFDPSDMYRFSGLIRHNTLSRLGYIADINVSNGTVRIKWLDHPGSQDNVIINQAALGSWEFPVIGAVVVAMMRAETPEILRYVPVQYRSQVSVGKYPSLNPGEKLFMSYKSRSLSEGVQVPTPLPTGTEFKMDNIGKIIMSDSRGDKWKLDPTTHSIESVSENYIISTEAGRLDFGIVYDDDGNIKFKDENLNQEPFTKFHLRILEVADLDPSTSPEVTDPFIEVSLGTKFSSTTGDPEVTTSTHAVAGEEIAIQLKTKANIGFEFVVDKSGNVTMKTLGNKKFKIVCDDLVLGGDGKEQPIVLKSFITDWYNNHQQIGNLGVLTSSPVFVPPVSPASTDSSNVVSKSVRSE